MLWADLFTGDEARMARKSKKPGKLTLHLRLDAETHERLVKAAEESDLSLEKEAVARLKKTFADDDQLFSEIEAHNTRLVRLEEEWQRLADIGKPEQKHDKETDMALTQQGHSSKKRP